MRKIWILAAAVVLAALFATCSLFGSKTSIDQCITNFMSDINSADRSQVYTTLDSASGQYGGAKTASYWDTRFPVAEVPTYTLSAKNTSASPATATITSSYTFTGGYPIIFVMSTDNGGNAVINSITITGPGTIFN
jgi:hypothetical protein